MTLGCGIRARDKSPKKQRFGGKLSPLRGGWKSVRKSNPILWKKVLDEVKKEPGPWAAWKAIKADKIYQQKGGKFLSPHQKRYRNTLRTRSRK